MSYENNLDLNKLLVHACDGLNSKINYLMHHGTLGQKWGIRNYQYKDGTYTPEGKERRRKSYGEMTDDELRTYLNRKRMERDAYQIDQELAKLNPEKVSLGKQVLNKVMKEVITPAATNAGKQYLENLMKSQMKTEETDEDKAKRESILWTNKANAERQKNSYYEEVAKSKERDKKN